MLRSSVRSSVRCARSAWLAGTQVDAQSRLLRTFSLDQTAAVLQSTLPSNSVTHIAVQGSSVWIGTGKGLARSTDGGQALGELRRTPEFARPGIFAIALAAAIPSGPQRAIHTDVDGQSVQTGSGYTSR